LKRLGGDQRASIRSDSSHRRSATAASSAYHATPCRASGEIRPDVATEDVLTSMNAVWTIAAEGEQWAAQARRVLRLLMDGLRYGAGAVEDVAPLGAAGA
jgi:hypothetical protein